VLWRLFKPQPLAQRFYTLYSNHYIENDQVSRGIPIYYVSAPIPGLLTFRDWT